MRSVPAIYYNGQIHFGLYCPDYMGPVSVLVVFPEAQDLEYYEDQIDPFELDLVSPAPPEDEEEAFWEYYDYQRRIEEAF